MSALTAARNTKAYAPGTLRSYPMDALAVIYEGGIVALDSTGYAVPGSASTTQLAVGIAMESKTAGAVDGDTSITVNTGVFSIAVDSAFAATNVGSLCYILNDQTVTMTSAAHSIAGVVAALDGTTGAWVSIGLEAAIDNTTLTSYENSVAATTNGNGASLVGIEDAAGYYGATTVEGALIELTEEPLFSVSCPIPALSAVADAGVLFRFKPLFKCKIVSMSVSTTTAVTTAAKATTLTPKIAGVSVTGGVCAITSANLNAIGAAVYGTAVTAAQTVSASAEVTVVASSTTTFVEGAANITIFFGRA